MYLLLGIYNREEYFKNKIIFMFLIEIFFNYYQLKNIVYLIYLKDAIPLKNLWLTISLQEAKFFAQYGVLFPE